MLANTRFHHHITTAAPRASSTEHSLGAVSATRRPRGLVVHVSNLFLSESHLLRVGIPAPVIRLLRLRVLMSRQVDQALREWSHHQRRLQRLRHVTLPPTCQSRNSPICEGVDMADLMQLLRRQPFRGRQPSDPTARQSSPARWLLQG